LGISRKKESRTRVQIVTPRSGRRVSKRSQRSRDVDFARLFKSATALARPAAALVALILVIVAYNALASSSLFELRRLDLTGMSPDLRPEVEQAVRRAVNQSRLLDVDLMVIKKKIEELPRVREASVGRLLPDGLYVRAVERQPAVLVRRLSQSLVWLDSDAIEMGEFTEVKHGADVPPILKGFAEGNRSAAAISDDQERIALYRRIEREMRGADQPLWDLIDEIDLTFPMRVNLRLANSPVTVVVGGGDFRNEFETALKVLGAAKEGDWEKLSRFGVRDPEQMIRNLDSITFIDTSRPDRIVFSFSTRGKETADEQSEQRNAQNAAAKKPASTPPRPGAVETAKSRPQRKN
jgi:cell division septal protein FtsQ